MDSHMALTENHFRKVVEEKGRYFPVSFSFLFGFLPDPSSLAHPEPSSEAPSFTAPASLYFC